MCSVQFDKFFRLIRSVVKLQPHLKRDGLVFPAVNYHNRASHPADKVNGRVIESCKPPHWNIRIITGTDVSIGSKGAFENKAAGAGFAGKISGDGAAQRPAEYDDLLARDFFDFGKPPEGGAGVEISSCFRWFAPALAVAAIIENEAIQAKPIEQVDHIEVKHYVAPIAVAVKNGEVAVGCGNEPAVKLEFVGGAEVNILEIKAKLSGGIGNLANGAVNEFGLHKIERQRKNGVENSEHNSNCQHCRKHRGILICPADSDKIQSGDAKKKENAMNHVGFTVEYYDQEKENSYG